MLENITLVENFGSPRMHRVEISVEPREHLEIHVLRGLASKLVAHPAADNERAASRIAHGARDIKRKLRWL